MWGELRYTAKIQKVDEPALGHCYTKSARSAEGVTVMFPFRYAAEYQTAEKQEEPRKHFYLMSAKQVEQPAGIKADAPPAEAVPYIAPDAWDASAASPIPLRGKISQLDSRGYLNPPAGMGG